MAHHHYKYNKVTHEYHFGGLLAALAITVLLLAGLTSLFISANQPQDQYLSSAAQTIAQTPTPYQVVQEPLFSFHIPIGWKQVANVDAATEHLMTWQDMAKNQDNRTLSIYINTIPSTYAVNHELPVQVKGNSIVPSSSVSPNCNTFTPGGSLDVAQVQHLQPALSTWQGVKFICNLPNPIDDQVGTGSSAGVNTVTVSGAHGGTNKYFFLYIDRNINPNYNILYAALQSFRAK